MSRRNKKAVKVIENLCLTCAKKFPPKRDRNGGCYALTERLGKYGECFAWSDDKEWFVKLHDVVKNYRRMKKNAAYLY